MFKVPETGRTLDGDDLNRLQEFPGTTLDFGTTDLPLIIQEDFNAG